MTFSIDIPFATKNTDLCSDPGSNLHKCYKYFNRKFRMGNCIASPDGLIVSSKDTLAPTVQSDNHSLVILAEQRSVVKPSEQQPLKFETPQPPLKPTAEEIERMLDVIEYEILPKTSQSVAEHGNKIFGAAVLSEDYKETIIAETNNEMVCPLFHAEIHAIKQVCHVIPPGERGTEFAQSIFLSTHVSIIFYFIMKFWIANTLKSLTFAGTLLYVYK